MISNSKLATCTKHHSKVLYKTLKRQRPIRFKNQNNITSDSYLKGGGHISSAYHYVPIYRKWCRFNQITNEKSKNLSCQAIWLRCHFTNSPHSNLRGTWSSFESARKFPFIIPNSKDSQISELDPVITMNNQSLTSRLSSTALLGEVKSNLLPCSGADGWKDGRWWLSTSALLTNL